MIKFTLVDSEESVPWEESSGPEDLQDFIVVGMDHPDLGVSPLNTESE